MTEPTQPIILLCPYCSADRTPPPEDHEPWCLGEQVAQEARRYLDEWDRR